MQLQCPHCSTVLSVNSPGGTQVQCPNCQGIFVVPSVASQAPPSVAPTITPRQPGAKSSPNQGAVVTDPATGEEGEATPRREIPWKAIEKTAYAVIFGVFSAAAVFGILIFTGVLGSSDDTIDNTPYVADGQANSGNQIQEVMDAAEKGEVHIKWVPAKNSATMQGFKVKVDHVDWGEVRGRDASGGLITSDRPFIIVYLETANRSDKTFDFKSWYGNEFVTENGAIRTAQLSDDDKSVYYPLRFDDLKQLKWHIPSKTFQPLDEGTDAIVFDVPEDFDPGKLENLYLDLPGEAVGLSGSYRFQIPRTMIRGI